LKVTGASAAGAHLAGVFALDDAERETSVPALSREFTEVRSGGYMSRPTRIARGRIRDSE
jgi:hypothetical protein